MKKIKITVLQTTFNEDLAKEYGIEDVTTCPIMEKGQVFFVDQYKPEGFCNEAWKVIHPYVFALANGTEKEVFYNWKFIQKLGATICSCNDRLRPVIFKLQITE